MIDFENVGFHYDDRPILQNINLHIPQGSFVAITGVSGAGKSTLLKLISMRLHPTEGHIRLFSHDTQEMDFQTQKLIRRKIGFIDQDPLFVEHLSVWENALLPVIVSELNVEKEASNVHDLLSWVGIAQYENQFPHQLSGGERQRLALARSIILSPEITIADEPTGNVDWEIAETILSLLLKLNELGKTVIIATHDMNLLRAARKSRKLHILRIAQQQIHKAEL